MPKIIGIDLGTTNSVAAIVEALFLKVKKIMNLKEFLKCSKYSTNKLKKQNSCVFTNLTSYYLSLYSLMDFIINNSFKNPIKLKYFSLLISKLNI